MRKDVTGLNFDYLSFNLLGSTLYSAFNVGLFFCSAIEVRLARHCFPLNIEQIIFPQQDEYLARYPRGLNPVLLNDVFFSVHALLAVLFTIWQCFIYEVM